MKRILMICLFLIIISLTACDNKGKKSEWNLIWSDEFDGDSLDLTKWSYQTGNGYNGWGNYEAQCYSSNNVAVNNGVLTITAKREDMEGCKYTSGRIRTMTDEGKCLFGFQYGKIEAKIALTKGDGLWPAFWMMPVNNEYGSWPLSGEIDIMEARGRIPDIINGTIHYGEILPNNKFSNKEYTFENGEDITSYHIYAVEWDSNEIKWTVDGKEYYRTSNWYTKCPDGNVGAYPAPFDKPFYIIFNMAVGGTYDDGVLPNENMQPAEMKVDYIRVYENVNGYAKASECDRESERDVKEFNKLEKVDNYIQDTEFSSVNLNSFSKTPEYKKNTWFFLVKDYFDGKGSGKLEQIDGKTFFKCHIIYPGDKRYSLQLQHIVPLVKGYTYAVEFDAMAGTQRMISFQPIGIKGDEIISYNTTQEFTLSHEIKHYYCSFTMKEHTDLSAIMEFNFGKEMADVYFGNVKVSCIN